MAQEHHRGFHHAGKQDRWAGLLDHLQGHGDVWMDGPWLGDPDPVGLGF